MTTLKDFFSVKKRWTRGAFAKTADTRVDIELGQCFCLVGAMLYLYNDKKSGEKGLSKVYVSVLNKLRKSMTKLTQYIDLVQLNDLGGYKKVMEVIEHAGV